MTSLIRTMHDDASPEADAVPPEPLWRKFLLRLTDRKPAEVAAPIARTAHAGRDRLPVFRLNCVRQDFWVVVRPESPIEHAFGDPESAEAFVRREAGGSPATIEFRIGDLYVAARLDRDRPPLFREPS